MFRLLIALALVRLLAQSTGLDLLVDVCDTPCQESQDGGCAPGCDDCLCCPHHRSATAQTSVAMPAPDTKRAELAAIAGPALQPMPNEILHVPKRALSV